MAEHVIAIHDFYRKNVILICYLNLVLLESVKSCVLFQGKDKKLIVGTYHGEIKIFNLFTGTVSNI